MDTAVQLAERQAQAVRPRAAGLTYDEIAERLGYSTRSGAYKAVRKALKDTVAESVEELRTIEMERLDDLLSASWHLASDPSRRGCVRAIDRVLRIKEMQCPLVGVHCWRGCGGRGPK
jgi:hypothetical protein